MATNNKPLLKNRVETLEPELSLDKKSAFKDWKFLKPKSGGANEAGEYGGVYQSADGNITAMIKQEASSSKNIAEFLGSKFFAAISPGNGAEVSLIAPDGFSKSKNSDSQIYVRSEFFKNYSSDMYVDMDKHMSAETKPSSWFRKDGGRPLFMGARNKLFRTLENAFKEVKYQNFENIMPTSLLIGDFDIHVGNIGVIRDEKNPKILPKLVRIDFAGSFDKLTNQIYSHSRMRHLPGFGPTNHFREFPSKLRRSPELGDSLIAASKINLAKTINESFDELTKYYSDEAIADFAKQAMPGLFKKSEKITPQQVKDSLLDVMLKRQKSLKEYGLEIKLTNVISKKYTYPYFEIKEQELKSLMKEQPNYFEKILKGEEGKIGGKKFKLRDKVSSTLSKILETLGIRPSAKKHLIKTIKSLNEEVNSEKDLIDFSKEVETKKVKAPAKEKAKPKEKPNLLDLNEEDLKAIKHLKKEVLKPTKLKAVEKAKQAPKSKTAHPKDASKAKKIMQK
ncbi:hypothetical protein [Rickettsia endosymbiont of Nabis limbatus]|uniref:hypothetical protein n=1 Tax=Rickettsia endosymbiont of Nabis limbatus TaxID=3066268 RepID=UPI003AF3615D